MKFLTKTLIIGSAAVAVTSASGQQMPQGGPRVDLGKMAYERHCASCHGVSGKGDGPMAKVLTRKVVDLTTLAARNNGILPVSEMYNVITGEKEILSHGSREMPVWGQEFRIQASKEREVRIGGRDYGIFPFDEEAYVRAQVLTVIEYINRLQAK